MNLSLVDPDNRGPVDYNMRKKLIPKIREIGEGEWIEPFTEASNLMNDADRWKLFVVMTGLRARRRHRRLFSDGSYIPLEIAGTRGRHAVSFARNRENAWCVAAVPRFPTGLGVSGKAPPGTETWGDARAILPPSAPRKWKNELTGQSLITNGELFMGKVFERFPVGLLTGVSDK
jgi:(1->4)-alpha-D-glucan 1-alpha-D-glucosylmutase